jgi:hypothetical protein
MFFAIVLGWVNTRLLLGLFFFLLVTPVGLVLRLVRRDPLDRKFDASAATYWKRRGPQRFERGRYQRMF